MKTGCPGRWLAYLTTALVLGLSACSNDETATQLLVVVSADPALAASINRLEIASCDAKAANAEGRPQCADVRSLPLGTTGADALPLSFTVTRQHSDALLLLVGGYNGDSLIIEQKLFAMFVDGQLQRVNVALSDGCRGVVCSVQVESLSTCYPDSAGACVAVTTARTQRVSPGAELDALDAGFDGSVTAEADAANGPGLDSASKDDGGSPLASDATAQDTGLPSDSASIPQDAQPPTCAAPCGANAACEVANGTASCRCLTGYEPDAGACVCVPGSPCSMISCPALSSPENGTVATPGGLAYGQRANYECERGYKLAGNAARSCGLSGMWSGVAPACERIVCPTLPNPTFGTVTAPSVYVDQMASYSCGTNYLLTAGDAKRTCGTDGKWTGTEPRCAPRFVEVATGGSFSCGRRIDGTVACWGQNHVGQLGRTGDTREPAVVPGLSNVRRLGADDQTTYVVLGNNTAYWWGDVTLNPNATSRLTYSSPTQIAIGAVADLDVAYDHACALMTSGTFQCWGDNTWWTLGNGTNAPTAGFVTVPNLGSVTQFDAAYGGTCARKDNGTLMCWGNIQAQMGVIESPTLVPGVSTATQVSLSVAHACAVQTSGTVLCWGYNPEGRLGNGTLENAASPVAVSGLNDAVQVATGTWHSCAVRRTGNVVCWGQNAYGRLGNGTSVDSNVPVTVTGLTGATQVAAAHEHTCAVRNDGNILCWGRNTSGQTTSSVESTLTPFLVQPPP